MINIINWKTALANSSFDEKVGVTLTKLAGDDSFATYLTIIEPHKSTNAHFHRHGTEHYHIISGKGEIHFKDILDNSEEVKLVAANESFIIPINMLHQLINTSNEPLILMFSCPLSHLREDRHSH